MGHELKGETSWLINNTPLTNGQVEKCRQKLDRTVFRFNKENKENISNIGTSHDSDATCSCRAEMKKKKV